MRLRDRESENIQLVEEENFICIKRNGERNEEHSVLLNEHAMDIYTDGQFYMSVVCTQEWMEELVIGRLVSDGMIKSMNEMKSLRISEDYSVVDVELLEAPEIMEGIYAIKDNCEMISSCFYPDEWVFAMADTMAAGMPLHERTWATHSCYLFGQGKLLFSCEDISRHNAVDKVIGYAVKNKIGLSQCALYTSGRVPSDMIDKVIIAGIPVLVSKGMPTMQAVELAKDEKITLICGARRDQMRIYTDYREK